MTELAPMRPCRSLPNLEIYLIYQTHAPHPEIEAGVFKGTVNKILSHGKVGDTTP